MIMSEKISVVMPCYNSHNTIRKSVESVMSQNYDNLELIIVIDNSDRFSHKIVYDLTTEYESVRSVCLLYKKGASSARNLGIFISSGKYLAFLDSDDTWDSKFLAKSVDCMNNSKVDFLYSII